MSYLKVKSWEEWASDQDDGELMAANGAEAEVRKQLRHKG